jgi:hypothetical protein
MTWQPAVWSRAGLLAALLFAAGAPAAELPNLAGLWKLAAPQTSLQPEGGGAIPFTATGRKFYNENRHYHSKRQFDEYDYTQSRCSAPGMPRMLLMPGRIQIYQRPDLVTMFFEWNRLTRMIPLPGLPPQRGAVGGSAEDLVGTNAGTASGHWEGDTLVVTTDKFSDKALIDDLVPHGYDLMLTEHIRLKDSETLEDRITIDDQEYFTRSWTAVVRFTRQPEAILHDDVCLDRLQGAPPLATD